MRVINFYPNIFALNLAFRDGDIPLLNMNEVMFSESYPANKYSTAYGSENKYTCKITNAKDSSFVLEYPLSLILQRNTTIILAKINGNLTPINLIDNFETLKANECGIRFVNISEKQEFAATLQSNEPTPLLQMPDLSYLSYTQFQPRISGKYVLNVMERASQTIIAKTDSVTLNPNKYYAFYLFDDTDGTTKLKMEEILHN